MGQEPSPNDRQGRRMRGKPTTRLPLPLSERDAACYLGMESRELGRLRRLGLGPTTLRSAGGVRYEVHDLDRWAIEGKPLPPPVPALVDEWLTALVVAGYGQALRETVHEAGRIQGIEPRDIHASARRLGLVLRPISARGPWSYRWPRKGEVHLPPFAAHGSRPGRTGWELTPKGVRELTKAGVVQTSPQKGRP